MKLCSINWPKLVVEIAKPCPCRFIKYFKYIIFYQYFIVPLFYFVLQQSFDENEEEDEEEDQLDENSSNVFGITTVINLTDKKVRE